ncbi:hypothetical protein Ddc_14780 [Ditylenchus destructor]|nr:hypothetical protein Ddc_14780 [Ditylenchus destructor]
MSSIPNEVLSVITRFLADDHVADLILLSRNFNAHVTPRLKKIDEEMATMNQSIKSFTPFPAPDSTDNEWISQLDLKRFLPIGSEAKKQMKKVFENYVDLRDSLGYTENPDVRSRLLPILKKRMSLERFDDPTFLRIVGALIATPKFRQEYNVEPLLTFLVSVYCVEHAMTHTYGYDTFHDVHQIMAFYKENF